MDISSQQAARFQEQATDALRRGDGVAALAALGPLTGRRDEPLLLLVQAHLLLKNHASAERAVDRILAIDPRHIGALIFKADCRLELLDSKAATAFYTEALRTAAGMPNIPVALQQMLVRAQAALNDISSKYEHSLLSRLEEAGIGSNKISRRLGEALDILSGRKQIYQQQPVSFYYPGLPQIQFYEREQFDWVQAIEAEYSVIREELLAILDEDDGFKPYVESDPSRPAKRNSMVGDPRWSAYYLWQGGERVIGQAERCPRTMAALERAPIPQISKRSPMALFSMLKPGMHILPHTGFLNTRLICHLPLIVPNGCRLRVGNDVRAWEEGKLLIFDDSIEHEAWNDGDDIRIVLLFEIWRPEIEEVDREALTILFEHISNYSD